MASNTTTASALLLSNDVNALLVQPVMAQSIAAQIATVVHTSSHGYRVPVLSADATAGWFAESAEITPSDPTLSEILVVPSKVAALTIVSRKLAEDGSPDAAATIGSSLSRDISRQIDAALFGNTTVNGPSGLLSITPGTSVEAATSFTTLDSFAGALSAAQTVFAQVNTFVTSPAEALALARLKGQTGSNQPLLGADPTAPTATQIYGLPLLVSPSVSAKTVWAIPRDRLFLVVRADSTVEVDTSVYFTSDRVAIKARMRVGIGIAHPAACIKITHALFDIWQYQQLNNGVKVAALSIARRSIG